MDQEILKKFKIKLKSVPIKPGVYEFLGGSGEVLYIGKAKNLRARLAQYLNGSDKRVQLPFLMQEALDFSYTLVNSELESLFLENTLIKEQLPKYNILLRDDKNYAFIKINYNFQIPQIEVIRKIDDENIKLQSASWRTNYKPSTQNRPLKINHQKSVFFGPFSAAYKIRGTLNLIRRIFPYCSANKVSSRPCFYYYLHRCPGVCVGKISHEEYLIQLKKIEQFLRGDIGEIKKELEAEMKTAAGKQLFEKAGRLRDQIKALTILAEKQTVIMPKNVDWDIVSLAFSFNFACINLFKVRGGKLLDKDNFVYEINHQSFKTTKDLLRQSEFILQNFLEQYYLESSNIPKEIYLQGKIESQATIKKLLQNRFGKIVRINIAKVGKPKELLKLGQTNAEEYLKNYLTDKASQKDKINLALEQLREKLNLSKIPERIECYDISNFHGTNAVGSMVVFEKGLPKKSEYRKFKINRKNTPDDFAMMQEMLERRFKHLFISSDIIKKENWPLPDLVVIDGGKGQLNAALSVLRNFHPPTGGPNFIHQLADKVIGLAKREEEIFLPEKSEPIVLDHNEPGLQLLQRLRDEAHRFGITFHRALRSKQAVKSALDDISGVGPKTKKLLKQKFGTVKQIKQTSFTDLSAVVGEKLAKNIKQNL